jgi:hypothetical protein
MKRERQTTDASPRYDEKTQRLIRRFLAAAAVDAQDKLAAFRKMAGKDTSHPLFAGNILYVQHLLASIKWLAYRATLRQSHLLVMSDDDVRQLEETWQLPLSNLSGPEPSGQSASSITSCEARRTDGDGSSNGPGRSSPTRASKPSGQSSNGVSVPPNSRTVSTARPNGKRLRGKRNGH